MYSMFEEAPVFNQKIGSWNTASVTEISFMFKNAVAFNKDISCWNLVSVTSATNGFMTGADAYSFDEPKAGETNSGNVCATDTCPAVEIAHSDKVGTDNKVPIGTFGDAAVTVTCDTGYTASNAADGAPTVGTVTCGSSGTFSALTCAANSCTPKTIAHSTGAITGTTGETKTVTCEAGYISSGDITCEASGSFTDGTCEADTCTPKTIDNSDKTGAAPASGTTGEVVTFTCAAGFTASNAATDAPLVGTVTCETNGEFSDESCNLEDISGAVARPFVGVAAAVVVVAAAMMI